MTEEAANFSAGAEIPTPGTVDTSAQQATTPESAAPSFLDSVPEEYRDKGYMKEIDSNEKLYKAFDGLNNMMGKRPHGIPNENATPEEWGKFYNELGRPEESSGYEFETGELPEGLELNEELNNQFKELAHELGLTKDQAAKLFSFDLERQKASLEANAANTEEAQAKADEEFDALSKETFGDRAEQAIQGASETIKQYLPEHLTEAFTNLGNKELMILSSVLDGVRSDFMGEGSIPKGGASTSQGASRDTALQLMKEQADLMRANPLDPMIEEKQKQINAFYGVK